MPNNKNDGMLEDLVKLAVDPSEHKLFSLAANTVAKIPAPKFKHQHISKAEVATWLAWQEAPGRGMEHAIKAELIDKENSDYKKMITWLNHVFG